MTETGPNPTARDTPPHPPTAQRVAELDPDGADRGRSARERLLRSAPRRDADVPPWFARAEQAGRRAIVALAIVALGVAFASAGWLRASDWWESFAGWSGGDAISAIVRPGARAVFTWYPIPRAPTAVGSLLLLAAAAFATTTLPRPGALGVGRARALALSIFVIGATAAAFAGQSFRSADVDVLPVMAIVASACELALAVLLARHLVLAFDGVRPDARSRRALRGTLLAFGAALVVLHVDPARVLFAIEIVVNALAGAPYRSFGSAPTFALLVALGVVGVAALVRIRRSLREAIRDAPTETWTIDRCRARDARCLDCGYDLTMSGDRCPECAGPATPLAVRSALALPTLRALVASIAILLCAPLPTFLFAGAVALALEAWRRIDVGLGLRLQNATARVISFELVQPIVFLGALLFAGTIVTALAGHGLATALLPAETRRREIPTIGWAARAVVALAAVGLATVFGPASFRAFEVIAAIDRGGSGWLGPVDLQVVVAVVAAAVVFTAVLIVVRAIEAARLAMVAVGSRRSATLALTLGIVVRVCAGGLLLVLILVATISMIGALAPGTARSFAAVLSLLGVASVLLGPLGLGLVGSVVGLATGLSLLGVARAQARRDGSGAH